MITLATAAAGDDEGGLPPGVIAMDMGGKSVESFVMGFTTITEEVSDSEEDSGGEGSSFQPGSEPESAQVPKNNARPFKIRNGKRTLRDSIYCVLQDAAGESLRVKEIHARILAKKLYVFRRKDGSVSTDDEKMRMCVSAACSECPLFARVALGIYAIDKEYLNGPTTHHAVRPSPLKDAIYHVLQDAGGSLHYHEIQAKIQAKKLFVFRRKDGTVHTDPKVMQKRVGTACTQSPRFVRTACGTYALPKNT